MRLLSLPTCTFIPLEDIVKELAPIIVNWSVREDFIASIAVNIPINAIIPNAIIQIVSIDRTLFDLIALSAILRFSRTIPFFIFFVQLPSYYYPLSYFPQWGKRSPSPLGNPDSYREGRGVINEIL